MGKYKDWLIGYLEDLSKKSGYSYEFLANMWEDFTNDDGPLDLDYFTGVTMERDW